MRILVFRWGYYINSIYLNSYAKRQLEDQPAKNNNGQ